MTTERRGLFVFRTDDIGTKCAAECPHTEPVKGHWCDVFGAIHGMRRPIGCTSAEFAAREAEVDALQRGYALRDEYDADDMDADLAPYALGHVIEHIRGGGR